jgi:hypothetical protein
MHAPSSVAELVETRSPQAHPHATTGPGRARSRNFCAIVATALLPLAAACGGNGSSSRLDAGDGADATAGI